MYAPCRGSSMENKIILHYVVTSRRRPRHYALCCLLRLTGTGTLPDSQTSIHRGESRFSPCCRVPFFETTGQMWNIAPRVEVENNWKFLFLSPAGAKANKLVARPTTRRDSAAKLHGHKVLPPPREGGGGGKCTSQVHLGHYYYNVRVVGVISACTRRALCKCQPERIENGN